MSDVGWRMLSNAVISSHAVYVSLRFGRSFNRNAFNRMNPVASLWSYPDVSPSIVANHTPQGCVAQASCSR
jgi:hypothetical protein